MNEALRHDANQIIKESIAAVLPDEAVRRALKEFRSGAGKTVLVAVGKAAWQMASAAAKELGTSGDQNAAGDNLNPDYGNAGGAIDAGIVITKYGHVKGELPGITCYEAGHPIPDENSFFATEKAIELVVDLGKDDTVLFLLSGGGSSLFEAPMIPGEEIQDITKQLLACGANIVEMNTVRKRLSKVKGGRFAQICAPAKVFSIFLSKRRIDPLA